VIIENHIFTRGYATRENIAFYDHSWIKFLSYTNIQQISSIYFFVIMFYSTYNLFLFFIQTSTTKRDGSWYLNIFKMLGLYLDTLIIGHRYYNMLSILNELAVQKELQIFLNRESNPGSLSPQPEELPVDHRVNWMYRLLSSYLTVSTQCKVT